MRDVTFFETIVQPSVERIPLLEIQYEDRSDERPCIVSHILYRNVFTEFDFKLSRHLAATAGAGFPAVSAAIRVRAAGPLQPWHDGPWLHFPSVPHALRGISRRALGDRETADLFLGSVEAAGDDGAPDGQSRTVERSDVQALGAALDFGRALGAFEFLDVSGDLDMILVAPAGGGTTPISMDLFQGTVTVPGGFGSGAGEPFEGPLFDFRRLASASGPVRSFVANARQKVTQAKERAVLDFRAAAEERILAFDRALRGRPLDGHRLDAVMSLVARLRAGLGDGLSGISEDARITALDWSEAVGATPGAGTGPNPSGTSGSVHPLPGSGRRRAAM